MDNKTYRKAVKSALKTIIGLGITGIFIMPTAQANSSLSTTDNTTPSLHNVVAKNPSAPIKEFIVTKLYQHSLNQQKAVTLHLRDIPLLTFIDAPEHNALENATKLATNLEQISENPSLGNEILVVWNPDTQNYVIQLDGKELTVINEYVILPDGTDNLSQDALQATNRLRRLLSNASPLKEIKGQPKTVARKNRTSAPEAAVKSLRRAAQGIASWYGPGFHGRRTASGETFNQNALTAAHRYLPFGTRVRVTNMRNGRSVVVRINDRGPFARGRIVDLSAAAASAIGLKRSGVAPVQVQVLN